MHCFPCADTRATQIVLVTRPMQGPCGVLHSYQVLSHELVGVLQHLDGVCILGSQALLPPVKAGNDHLAAHEEALPRWQICLAGQLAGLGQQIRRQVLQCTARHSEFA